MPRPIEAALLPLLNKLEEEDILRFGDYLPHFLNTSQQSVLEAWAELCPLVSGDAGRSVPSALSLMQPDVAETLQSALLSFFGLMKRHASTSANHKAEEALQNAGLLVDMSLYEQARPLLEKVKDWASRCDLQLLMLNALELETRVCTRLHEFDQLNEIGKQEWEAHRKLQNQRAYVYLASQIFNINYTHGKAFTPEIEAEIQRLNHSPLLVKEAKAFSPRAAIQYNACKSYLCDLAGEKAKGILYQERMLEIYEEHPDMLRLAPSGYVAAAGNLISSLVSVRRYERALQNLDDLQSLERRHELNPSAYHRASLFFNVLLNRAAIYKLQGNMELFGQSCKELDGGLVAFEGHVKRQNVVEAQNLIAESCLVHQDFGCAEARCRKILEMEGKSVMQTQFANAHLLLLAALVEQRKWEDAEVGIEGLKVYFERHNRYVKTEIMILEIVQRFVRERSGSDLSSVCREYLEVLEQPGGESELYGAFNTDDYFDVTRWLKDRLSRAEMAGRPGLHAGGGLPGRPQPWVKPS